MFEVDNFISFHDLSPNGTFIWTSPSVTAILGYEPEEIEGVPAYDMMHKDDIAYCRITHQENVLNDMVGTQIVVRFKHKDGSYVPCMVIFSVCYDYIVTCSTVIDTAQEACKYFFFSSPFLCLFVVLSLWCYNTFFFFVQLHSNNHRAAKKNNNRSRYEFFIFSVVR